MSSSGSDTDPEAGGGEQDTFECVLCPGSLYTAAEKDIHRQYHREQRQAPKPGPASKRGRPPRVPAPPGSLFVIKTTGTSPAAGPSSARRPRGPQRKDKPPKPAKEPESPKKKRKSRKNYDATVDTNFSFPGA